MYIAYNKTSKIGQRISTFSANSSMSTELDNSTMSDDLNMSVVENPVKKKRGRANSLTSAASRDQLLLSAFEEMKNKFSSMENNVSSKIDALTSNMDAKIETLRSDFCNQISNLSANFDVKLSDMAPKTVTDSLQQEVNILRDLYKRSESRLDLLERESLLNRLVISGIPCVKNEDLSQILDNIVDCIGCDRYKIDAFRLKQKSDLPGGSRSHATILVKFCSSEERFQFFHKYLKFKNLCLSNIGIGDNDIYDQASPSPASTSSNIITKKGLRIYINELLTKKNSEILRLVRKLKDNKMISGYYTSRGVVYMTKNLDGVTKSTPVYNIGDLPSLE